MILAFDTSSGSGSIALLRDKSLIAEWTVGDAGAHAKWLMRSISGLLESSGCSFKDVDLFAVDTGPGSFTGLRIGVSTVKGLSWALQKKVVGVSTLEALSMNLSYGAVRICPVLDARKGEVYAGVYSPKNGRMEAVIPDSALTPQALVDRLIGLGPGPVVFLGSGLRAYGGFFKENLDGGLIAPEALWHIRASNIGLLAGERAAFGVAPGLLSPVYLRKSEAEIKIPQSRG